jgi:hypothetical protein
MNLETQEEIMEHVAESPAVGSEHDETVRARIAARAHELWQQRGEGHGSDLEDWLQAERELLAAPSEKST